MTIRESAIIDNAFVVPGGLNSVVAAPAARVDSLSFGAVGGCPTVHPHDITAAGAGNINAIVPRQLPFYTSRQ